MSPKDGHNNNFVTYRYALTHLEYILFVSKYIPTMYVMGMVVYGIIETLGFSYHVLSVFAHTTTETSLAELYAESLGCISRENMIQWFKVGWL